MRKLDMVLDTLRHVDLSDMHLPGVVVYHDPSDYRGKYIGRVFELAVPVPTDVIIIRDSLEAVREDIRAAGFRAAFARDRADKEQIVETWI